MFEAICHNLKKRLGWVASLQGASKSILVPAVRFSIEVDGTVAECASPLVLVANGASFSTPVLRVHPDFRYDDGALDVNIMTGTRATEIARMKGRFATRSVERSPFPLHLRSASISNRSVSPKVIQLDGDIVRNTPASFSILPNALDLIVPSCRSSTFGAKADRSTTGRTKNGGHAARRSR
jgi:diacylglycerol kinase family enzyme